jgi:hypothetical protein
MNDYIQCTAPSAWASYLINDDATGLDDGESAIIDAWLEYNQLGHCYDCEDAGFLHRHDASGYALAADCQLYTFEG